MVQLRSPVEDNPAQHPRRPERGYADARIARAARFLVMFVPLQLKSSASGCPTSDEAAALVGPMRQ